LTNVCKKSTDPKLCPRVSERVKTGLLPMAWVFGIASRHFARDNGQLFDRFAKGGPTIYKMGTTLFATLLKRTSEK
jgi:hypothetical protein